MSPFIDVIHGAPLPLINTNWKPAPRKKKPRAPQQPSAPPEDSISGGAVATSAKGTPAAAPETAAVRRSPRITVELLTKRPPIVAPVMTPGPYRALADASAARLSPRPASPTATDTATTSSDLTSGSPVSGTVHAFSHFSRPISRGATFALADSWTRDYPGVHSASLHSAGLHSPRLGVTPRGRFMLASVASAARDSTASPCSTPRSRGSPRRDGRTPSASGSGRSTSHRGSPKGPASGSRKDASPLLSSSAAMKPSPPRSLPVELVWTEARWRAFFGSDGADETNGRMRLHLKSSWRLRSVTPRAAMYDNSSIRHGSTGADGEASASKDE